MSLWRVKHTLSPLVEGALIATIAGYGLFAIWYASLAPFAVQESVTIGTVTQPVPLDTDAWTRQDVADQGYAFALPPDWRAVPDGTAIRLGRSLRELSVAGTSGEGVRLEKKELADRQEAMNVAQEEFAGAHAAFYEVAVDGRLSTFAIAFVGGRVARQAVYVPSGETVLIVRSASLDPAAFAALVSTIKFYTP